jgi:RNA polymerase sigma-70 factor, ECF subfamily
MTAEAGESDFALMRRAQNNDASGMGELYRRHVNRVNAAVCRKVANPDDVEDVTVEVFARAWRSRCSFRFEAPVLPWLLKIAEHCCCDHLKKNRAELSLDDLGENDERDWLLHLRCPGPEEPSQAFERREVQRCVRDALRGLPELYSRPLELFCLEGWTYAEIARELNIEPNTLPGRLDRGRKLLRRRLEPFREQLLGNE